MAAKTLGAMLLISSLLASCGQAHFDNIGRSTDNGQNRGHEGKNRAFGDEKGAQLALSLPDALVAEAKASPSDTDKPLPTVPSPQPGNRFELICKGSRVVTQEEAAQEAERRVYATITLKLHSSVEYDDYGAGAAEKAVLPYYCEIGEAAILKISRLQTKAIHHLAAVVSDHRGEDRYTGETGEFTVDITPELVLKKLGNPVAEYSDIDVAIVFEEDETPICTKIAGWLYEPITGQCAFFTDGCERAELIASGYIIPEGGQCNHGGEQNSIVTVKVSGSQWSKGFLYAIDDLGEGYPIADADEYPFAPLPWIGIDRIQVEFTFPAEATTFDLQLVAGLYGQYDFEIEPVAGSKTTYLLHLKSPIKMDDLRLLARFADKSESVMGFAVLPSDSNQDRRVNGNDLKQYSACHESEAGDMAYNPFADFNTDGRCSEADLQVFKDYYNQILP